ncbi:MAG: chromate resistance protein ChrB domain-containing protein [Candidatus Atabeyarchaeum deiterrae]
MLWVTRNRPHADRCASAWLIKRFVDKNAIFEFISKYDPIPKNAIAFTLPNACIKPVEGKKTTFDVLVEKHDIKDACVLRIGEFIHDFEIDAHENPAEVRLKETLGLCFVLKGLEKGSKTDNETIDRALVVLDAFYASMKEMS